MADFDVTCVPLSHSRRNPAKGARRSSIYDKQEPAGSCSREAAPGGPAGSLRLYLTEPKT
jgi:hypothetical protein